MPGLEGLGLRSPRAVELFAGIGGFRVACDAVGVDTVFANELSPLACAVYRDRFGSGVLREGDVANVLDEVPSHDLLTAGLPCQPFSFAGKKAGTRDVRGSLFQLVLDLIRRHRPRDFVIENVPGMLSMASGRHFAEIARALSSLDYSVEWRVMNAAEVGLPQNRRRIFLHGRRDGGAPALASARLISISDLLAVPSSTTSLRKHRGTFPEWGMLRGDALLTGVPAGPDLSRSTVRVRDILEVDVDQSFDFTDETRRRIRESVVIDRVIDGVHVLYNQEGGRRMGYTVFGTGGLAPTLTATTSRHYERYLVSGRFRRLTPVEYARIQGFPDDHCAGVSMRHQYVLLGNAVPPGLASRILKMVLTCRRDADRESTSPATSAVAQAG